LYILYKGELLDFIKKTNKSLVYSRRWWC